MIDQNFLSNVITTNLRLQLGSQIAGRPDIQGWAHVYVGLLEGEITPDDVLPFSEQEMRFINGIEAVLGTRDEINNGDTFEPMAPGINLPFYSVSPLFLVSKVIRSFDGHANMKLNLFSQKRDVEKFLYSTTLISAQNERSQKASWSFTFTEAANFLWMLRKSCPILFFLFISREYELAEELYPWIRKIHPKTPIDLVTASFANLQVAPATAIRVIGNAQRHKEMVLAVLPHQHLTTATLKSLSEEDDPVETIMQSKDAGLQSYMKFIGSSSLALRKSLMIDCDHHQRMPVGNSLSMLADTQFTGLLTDKILLGLGPKAAKALLADLYEQLTSAFATGRGPGNKGLGNDTVERFQGAGGHRGHSLALIYGHTIQQITCRFIIDTSAACGQKFAPTRIGTFADELLSFENTKIQVGNDPSALCVAANLVNDYAAKGLASFGAPSQMLSFHNEIWSRKNIEAGKWASLAYDVKTDSSVKKYFLIVRRYLHSFFFQSSRLLQINGASEVWAYLAHAATPASQDPIWHLLKKREAFCLGISANKRRGKSSAVCKKCHPPAGSTRQPTNPLTCPRCSVNLVKIGRYCLSNLIDDRSAA